MEIDKTDYMYRIYSYIRRGFFPEFFALKSPPASYANFALLCGFMAAPISRYSVALWRRAP